MVRLPRNWRVKFMLGISLAALLGVGMTYFLRPYLPQTSLHATNDVSAIAFTRDGRMMATGNDVDVQGHNAMGYWAYGAGEVQVRCGPDWRVVRAVPFLHSAVVQGDAEKNGGPIGWLRFSPDGGRLMVGNQDSSTFGVLDVATGRWLFSRQDNFDSAHHLFMPIGFSRDGQEVFYLDCAFGKPLSEQATRAEWSQAIHPAHLVTCRASDGKILRRSTQILGPGEWPTRLVLLPDSTTVACATELGDGGMHWEDTGKVVLMDIPQGKRLQIFPTKTIFDMDLVSSNGPLIASATEDGTARLLDTRTGRVTALSLEPGATFWQVALSPDGRFLAATSTEDTITLWDTGTGAKIRTLLPHVKSVASLVFTPDSRSLLGSQGRAIKIWTTR